MNPERFRTLEFYETTRPGLDAKPRRVSDQASKETRVVVCGRA